MQTGIANRANRWNIERLKKKIYIQALRRRGLGGKEIRRKAKVNLKTIKYLMQEFGDSLSLTSMITGSGRIEEVFSNTVEVLNSHKKSTEVQGALVALNPKTGDILTMVGGNTFARENQLNRVVQTRRQPGSAFKIFIYGAAIEKKKITPATSFDDIPIIYKGRRNSWSPSNYSKGFTGKVLVRRALAKSLNVVPARIYDIMGGRPLAKFASRLTGVPLKRFEIDPTLSLGSTELSPMELTKGIAVYANSGMEVKPRSILEIRNRSGKILYRAPKNGKKRLVSRGTSFIMSSLLKEVVTTGTASYAVRQLGGFRLPCAGKTGTNSRFRDAWFTGYTGNLAATVWVGCDSPQFSLGRGQSGSAVAAPLWGKYMREVYKTRKYSPLPWRPRSVASKQICTVTGKLPSRGCPNRNEFFLRGTEPGERCQGLHGKLSNIKELIKMDRGEYGETGQSNNLFKSWQEPQKSEEDKAEIREYNFTE